MLRQVTEHGLIGGQREAHAGGDQTMRFARLVLADYGEGHLTGLDMLQTFAAGNQFAVGRENRGDANDVARGNACVAQRQLKAGKALAVFPDSLGEENFLRDERHEYYRTAVPPRKRVEKTGDLKTNKHMERCQWNSASRRNLAVAKVLAARAEYYRLMNSSAASGRCPRRNGTFSESLCDRDA